MRLSNLFLFRLVFGLTFVLFAAPLLSQTFAPGDLVVTGAGPGPNPPSFTNWKILWLDEDGNLKGTLYDQPQTALAGSMALFGPGSTLYAIAAGQLLRVQADGTTSPIPTPSIIPSFFTISAIGDVYVNQLGGMTVLRVNAAGQLVQTINTGENVRSTDLAADQCTLYYTSLPPQVRRFNVCAGAALTPFSAPDPSASYGTLRIIPGGLLQFQTGVGILRRNDAGQVVQTYPGWGFPLALDPDRASFWTTSGTSVTPQLYRVDIGSGSVVRGPLSLSPVLSSVFSIAVVGEPRPALAAANTAVVPMFGLWARIALAFAVAAVAALQIRR